MKYLFDTCAYLFKYGKGKRFLTIFLLSLIPSAVVTYSYPLSGYVDFLFGFMKADYPNFSAMWLSAFRHDTVALIGLALAFVTFILFTAYTITVIARSVRVGEFGLTKIINSVNENFFPAIAVTVFCAVSLFVSHNLFIVLAFLFSRISKKVFGLVLTVVFFLTVCLFTVYFWSSLTLWLPTMSFSGQYVTRAFLNSFYKSRSYLGSFFVPSLIVFAFLAVTAFAAHFMSGVWYVQWIFNALCVTVAYTFILVFTAVAYCDVESVTREDAVKRYFGR